MNTRNKLLLAALSARIMLLTVVLIAVWFVGSMVSSAFDLQVFDGKTTDFLYTFLSFALVLVFCAALLNISLNIGLIAESKVRESAPEQPPAFFGKKFYLSALAAVVVLVAALFTLDFFNRNREEKKLLQAAEYILQTYPASIDSLAHALADSQSVRQAPGILRFLSNIRIEYPAVTAILARPVDGQLAFLEIGSWHSGSNLLEPYGGNAFFKCHQNECDYLQQVFKKQTASTFFWSKQNEYVLFYPLEKGDNRFVLAFSKRLGYRNK